MTNPLLVAETGAVRLEVVVADITTLAMDAIVNAANETLHRAGRRAGRRFLDKHFDDIGVRSTIDLRDEMRAEGGEELPAGVDRLAR